MTRRYLWVAAVLVAVAQGPVHAKEREYHLTIDRQEVNITGTPVEKITLNGTIPGPTFEFTEGDEAVIHVTNLLDEPSSVHWHGLILPGAMDGVPGFNGFHGIEPGETFTYRFPIQQSGTYWYHAHSKGQEQDGHYGSLVLRPKGSDPIRADRDYVVLLSDFTDEESDSILSNLKRSAEYYQYARRTVGDFIADASERGLSRAWEDAKMWGEMRMLPTDLSDVSGYTFLVNGKTSEQNWTGLFKPGETVRLRFINASAMSFYDVRIPGLKMEVVAADGQDVEPVPVDEFRFGVAETYDVLVRPKDDEAYSIVAEPIDRTGFAIGTLAPREGLKGEIPEQRPRTLLTMADMGMSHGGGDNSSMASMNHSGHNMPGMDMDGMDGMPMGNDADYETGVPGSGWADSRAPAGSRVLRYADLRYLGQQKDTRAPGREIEVRLGGNMERYIWTMNGKKFSDAEPMQLKFGERVRLTFVNETMMAHPMHLHGMFVQLENGQPAKKLPNKHTVIVAPGDSYSVLLTANQPGEWALHCHLLFHMMAGMMNKVVVAKLDPDEVRPVMEHPSRAASAKVQKEEQPAVMPAAPQTHGGHSGH